MRIAHLEMCSEVTLLSGKINASLHVALSEAAWIAPGFSASTEDRVAIRQMSSHKRLE